MSQPRVAPFYDPVTFTVSYVVYEHDGGEAAIIDPVLDYDAKSGRTSTHSAQQIVDFVREHALSVHWILETHAHADHLSGAHWLREQLGGRIAIGAHIDSVQRTFKPIFNLGEDFATDGSQFDYLFAEDELFQVGKLSAQALFVPGHTPADMAYLIGDALFVGDTIFMPDVGTARCDFPGGNAALLYRSVQKLYALPDETRVFVCHDYQPPTRPKPQWESTIAAQKAGNIHLHAATSEAEFVALREARDATLAMPVLIIPSIQVNVRAGELPSPAANGKRYLQIPLDVL
ncbi:MBL fold metallo-hydrolase [Chitinilyticum piscinae]|uniref:MBL fold metallo-hydrolase n=1 Tax=Chitinilyticum piscinae TaxID=2866724 RepID=A0A8J7K1V7_9NEIS|nr:MBL fold metallo-hydrolase [Chitinilyticum piscinae]MBE9609761.1 MBL fold metallo-hydrolase [Chitinilyticum piscinae]